MLLVDASGTKWETGGPTEWRQILEKNFGIPSQNIRILHSNEKDKTNLATADNIRDGLRWLAKCDEKCLKFFYFMGHGNEAPEYGIWDYGKKELIKSDELGSLLNAIKGLGKLFVIDCCYSENALKGVKTDDKATICIGSSKDDGKTDLPNWSVSFWRILKEHCHSEYENTETSPIEAVKARSEIYEYMKKYMPYEPFLKDKDFQYKDIGLRYTSLRKIDVTFALEKKPSGSYTDKWGGIEETTKTEIKKNTKIYWKIKIDKSSFPEDKPPKEVWIEFKDTNKPFDPRIFKTKISCSEDYVIVSTGTKEAKETGEFKYTIKIFHDVYSPGLVCSLLDPILVVEEDTIEPCEVGYSAYWLGATMFGLMLAGSWLLRRKVIA